MNTKALFLAVPFILFSTFTFSQKFQLGVKGTVGTSDISGSTTSESLLAYGGGAFASFKFTMVGVQADLLFQSAGTSEDVLGTTFKINTNYLQLPVVAKLYFLKVINVQGGVYYGYMLSASDNFGFGVAKDDFETSDFGAVAGLGFEVWKLNINARYQHGFTEVYSGNTGAASQNRAFVLGLGYSFL